MARETYKYNPETLTFEKHRLSTGRKLFRAFGFLSIAFLFSVVIAFTLYYFFPSPTEKKKDRDLAAQQKELDNAAERLAQFQEVINNLAKRDRDIYRSVFDADPLVAENILKGGIGGVDRYKYLESLPAAEKLAKVNSEIDEVRRKLVMLSKSYDELATRVTQKEEWLAHIPAIQPVNNKDLTRLASGFGYRIHPIYKVRKFHSGIDFSAPTGTPIYATGDGKIEKAKYVRGYGRRVIINHGYGHKTLYAHMSKIEVKRGQKVKRGELIGLVGSTGLSSGPHLHYEVIKNGQKVNPIYYFQNDLSPEDYEVMLNLSGQSNKSFD